MTTPTSSLGKALPPGPGPYGELDDSWKSKLRARIQSTATTSASSSLPTTNASPTRLAAVRRTKTAPSSSPSNGFSRLTESQNASVPLRKKDHTNQLVRSNPFNGGRRYDTLTQKEVPEDRTNAQMQPLRSGALGDPEYTSMDGPPPIPTLYYSVPGSPYTFEIWRPAISEEEDARNSTPWALGMRTHSITPSQGSTTLRPPIAADTIPESQGSKDALGAATLSSLERERTGVVTEERRRVHVATRPSPAPLAGLTTVDQSEQTRPPVVINQINDSSDAHADSTDDEGRASLVPWKVWRPAISQEEDARSSTPWALGMRTSSFAPSQGSTTLRPRIAADTIPEPQGSKDALGAATLSSVERERTGAVTEERRRVHVAAQEREAPNNKEEEASRKAERARLKEAETQRKAKEIKDREAALRRREAEANRKEEEAQEEARRKEERGPRMADAEAKRTVAQRREAEEAEERVEAEEIRREDQEARIRVEKEKQRKEAEAAITAREAETNRKEEEAREEARRKEERGRRMADAEAKRTEAQRRETSRLRREAEEAKERAEAEEIRREDEEARIRVEKEKQRKEAEAAITAREAEANRKEEERIRKEEDARKALWKIEHLFCVQADSWIQRQRANDPSLADDPLKLEAVSALSSLNSVDLFDIIKRVIQILHGKWASLEALTMFLPDSTRVIWTTSDNETLDLVTISTADRAEIHPVSPSATLETPRVKNTQDLRTLLLSDQPRGELLSMSRQWAKCFIELLQIELDNKTHDSMYRRRCLKCLQTMARHYGLLPPSFLINDAERDGVHPVSGGGFADIYQGRRGNHKVCLKVLRVFLSKLDRERLFKEFSHEALVWRQLQHPNVLPFIGVNVDMFQPSFCLISPWMVNGNILDFLETNPDHNRRDSVEQISKGLQYLHNLNPQVIHGDIRGANILISEDHRCCLADFGLALVTESQAFTGSSAALKGTLRWSAPEVLDHTKSHLLKDNPTARDIYALGCTIFEIYTRNPPFMELREGAVISAVLAGERPARPSGEHCISDLLWDLAVSCWAKDLELRPSIGRIIELLGS